MVQISIGRRHLVFLLLAVVVLVVAIPLAVSATTSMFADVPDDHIFVDDINWMKTAGVTQGCGDGTNYCPEADVTRGQMAAFMNRLAVNKVVNAGKLGGKVPGDYVSGTEWVSLGYAFNSVPKDAERTATVDCPGSKFPVAGGGTENGRDWSMTESFPYFSTLIDRGWKVTWQNQLAGMTAGTGVVWVLCADFEASSTFIPPADTDPAAGPDG
jgi:hypothetical protein